MRGVRRMGGEEDGEDGAGENGDGSVMVKICAIPSFQGALHRKIIPHQNIDCTWMVSGASFSGCMCDWLVSRKATLSVDTKSTLPMSFCMEVKTLEEVRGYDCTKVYMVTGYTLTSARTKYEVL